MVVVSKQKSFSVWHVGCIDLLFLSGQLASSVLPTGERRLGVHLAGPPCLHQPPSCQRPISYLHLDTCAITTDTMGSSRRWHRKFYCALLDHLPPIQSPSHHLRLTRANKVLSSRVTGFSSHTMVVLTLVTLMPKP